MKKLIVLLMLFGLVYAGPRFGGRIGYYAGNDPRTGESTGAPIYGGQFVMPLMSVVDLEISAGYTSSKSDIILSEYLTNYIEEEYGETFGGNIDSLMGWVEQEWGWENPTVEEMTGTYEATYHDLDVGVTLKVNIPIGSVPLNPYIGGGGGAHFMVSDADLLIAYIQSETANPEPINPYDHVHPGVHGVIGITFKPPVAPVSVFGEYRLSKPIGDTAGDVISMYYIGVNLGF